mmetsp:Transcript_14317/g.53968  ORF Transcript_14317/g.53968 Transcript_14317/m.53968 type:complete len:973 (-) Transcript_14317:332-3250(-)
MGDAPESQDLAVLELQSEPGEMILQFPGDGGDLVQFEPCRMNEESGLATGAKVLAVIPWSPTAEEQSEHPLWKLAPGYVLDEVNGVACWDMDFRDILQCTRNAMDGGLPRPLTLKFKIASGTSPRAPQRRSSNFPGFRGIRASVTNALARRGKDAENTEPDEDVPPPAIDASPTNGHTEHRRGGSVANRLGQTFRRVQNRLRSRGDKTELEVLERVRLAKELAALLPKITIEPIEAGAQVLAVRGDERTIGDAADAAVVQCNWAKLKTDEAQWTGETVATSFYNPNADDIGESLRVDVVMTAPSESDRQVLLKMHEEDKDADDTEAFRTELQEIADATGCADFGPVEPSTRLLDMHRSFTSFVMLWDGLCHTHPNVKLALRCGTRKPIVLGFTSTEIIMYERMPQSMRKVISEEEMHTEEKNAFLAAESENPHLCGKIITRLLFSHVHVRCDPRRDDAFALAIPKAEDDAPEASAMFGAPLLAGDRQTRDVMVLGIRALRARARYSAKIAEGEDGESSGAASAEEPSLEERLGDPIHLNRAAFQLGLDCHVAQHVVDCSGEGADAPGQAELLSTETLHPDVYTHLKVPSPRADSSEAFKTERDDFGEIFDMEAQSMGDYGFNPTASMASQLAFTNEEIDELRSQMKQLRTELSVSQNDRATLRDKVRSMQTESSEAGARIAQLEASLQATISEKDRVSDKLGEHAAVLKEREELREELDVREARLTQMKSEVDAANRDKERLATELAAAKEAAAGIDQAVKERDEAMARTEAHEQTLRKRQERIAELEGMLQASQQEARDASAARQEAETQLKAAEEKVKEADAENQAAQQKAEQLEQQRNGLKRKADSLARELDHITRVVGSVAEAEKKLAEFDKTRLDLAIAQAERKRAEDDAKELANVVEGMRMTIEESKRSMVKSQLSKAGNFLRRHVPRPTLTDDSSQNGSDPKPGSSSTAEIERRSKEDGQAKAGS